MFERRHEPLLPARQFYIRSIRNALISAALIFGSLGLGAAGYHWTEGLPWIDATLNAAMILTGMGPVDVLKTTGGKLFATGYALFSGVIFLSAAAVLLAPAIHRFIHRFHLDEESKE